MNTSKQKDKKTNNDLQNIKQKTKDRTTQILLKPEVNSCALEGEVVSASHVTPRYVTLVTNR